MHEENLAKIERIMVKLQQGTPTTHIAREEECAHTKVQRIRDKKARLDGKTRGRPQHLPEAAELYLAILIDQEIAKGRHIDSRCVTEAAQSVWRQLNPGRNDMPAFSYHWRKGFSDRFPNFSFGWFEHNHKKVDNLAHLHGLTQIIPYKASKEQ